MNAFSHTTATRKGAERLLRGVVRLVDSATLAYCSMDPSAIFGTTEPKQEWNPG